MSFRKPFSVKRTTPGAYVDGVFVEGTESTITIQASVQPLSDQDLQNLPEGRRESDMVKVYTNSNLNSVGSLGSGQQPDKIIWLGDEYEISSKSVRQMGVINHYRYFATKEPI